MLLTSVAARVAPSRFPAALPRTNSTIVHGLRAHSHRKVGNLAAEALAGAAPNELLEVTSERLDGVMLMVGD